MFQKIIASFAALLYPPLCVHCSSSLSSSEKILCGECLALMELIDPEERCPFCFRDDFQMDPFFCSNCSKKTAVFDRLAAAFDYLGPAATLIQRMKYGAQPYLSLGMGAFLAVQWIRLRWPKPDYLIPVPLSSIHFFERGFNQSRLLCESMSQVLNVPVVDVLARKNGDYSQAALKQDQRLAYGEWKLSLKKNRPGFKGKNLLIVDDVMTTGTTLYRCAEVLLDELPAALHGLVLCRA